MALRISSAPCFSYSIAASTGSPASLILTKFTPLTTLPSFISKVSINSEAVKNPDFIKMAANKFGSQAVIAAIDAKSKEDGSYEVVMLFL